MLPQRLVGKDLFWWLTRLGLLRVTVDSRLGRRASRREFIIGTNKRAAPQGRRTIPAPTGRG
jgi:putative flavoprotein involved in K+ transport